MSVDYAKQRKQVGKLIGEYQGPATSSPTWPSRWRWRGHCQGGRPGGRENPGDPEAAVRDVSAARVAVADAAYLSARTALQVHGAIGYTLEHDLGLWLTKTRALQTAWGTQSCSPRPRARLAGGRAMTASATSSAGSAPIASPGVDTDEQAALRQSVASLLEKKSDSEVVRAAMNSEDGYDPALWSTLVEQIGAALSIPEEVRWRRRHLGRDTPGGEELGRRFTPSPMLGSAVLVQAVPPRRRRGLRPPPPGIAAGDQAALCWAGAGGWATPGVRADFVGSASANTDRHRPPCARRDTASIAAGRATGDTVGLFELPASADGVTITRVSVMDPNAPAAWSSTRLGDPGITTRDSFLSRLRAAGWAATGRAGRRRLVPRWTRPCSTRRSASSSAA